MAVRHQPYGVRCTGGMSTWVDPKRTLTQAPPAPVEAHSVQYTRISPTSGFSRPHVSSFHVRWVESMGLVAACIWWVCLSNVANQQAGVAYDRLPTCQKIRHMQ